VVTGFACRGPERRSRASGLARARVSRALLALLLGGLALSWSDVSAARAEPPGGAPRGSERPSEPAEPPAAEIGNGLVTAKLYLPDPVRGYYRGTRFDWSGNVASLRYAGHEFSGPWFEGYDPLRHDAIMGPAEEFLSADGGLGYAEAKPGGTFVRIGVGVVRKPADEPYDRFRTYEVVDPGKWTIEAERDRIRFTHELEGPDGYAYAYRKTIALEAGRALLTVAHALRNTGRRAIETEQYNHNFFVLDRAPTGPATRVRFAFEPRGTEGRGLGELAELRGRELVFPRELAPGQSVFTEISGYSSSSAEYDIHVENRQAGIGVRAQGDRPLAKLVVWSIRTTVCPEPYVKLRVEPGREEAWTLRYELYELANPQAAPGATR
jgi:hypothetical protein